MKFQSFVRRPPKRFNTTVLAESYRWSPIVGAPIAFLSEADTGSRQENASKQEAGAGL
jgi:hypothetical protein